MKSPTPHFLVPALAFLLSALALHAAPFKGEHVTVDLIPEYGEIEPGKPFTVAIHMKFDAKTHGYWVNPGALGLPLAVKSWNLPAGFTPGPLQFPTPHQFDSFGDIAYGYEKEAYFLVDIQAPTNLAPGTKVPIGAELSWQVCDDLNCYPNFGQAFQTEVIAAAKKGKPSLQSLSIAQTRVEMPKAVDWPIDPAGDAAAGSFAFTIKHGDAIKSTEGLYYYLAEDVVNSNIPPTLELNGDTLKVGLTLKKNKPAPKFLTGILTSKSGFTDPALGHAVSLSNDKSGGDSSAAGAAVTNTSESTTDSGWAYWLRQPFIVSLLIALLLLISLNLFGVFEVGSSLVGIGGSATHQSGLAGSFMSGALAVILATPCSAPLMGSALAYAMGQPAMMAILIFTALGVGMALPYMLLSAFPQWLKLLPKPGAWMETFKQVMAFPMLAVVAWLISVLAKQITPDGLFWALTGLVILALAAYLYGRYFTPIRQQNTRITAAALALILVVISVAFIRKVDAYKLPPSTQDPAAEIAALQKQGKNVFVDFTAAWCQVCQQNKHALHSEAAEAAYKENNVAFLVADLTTDNAKIRAMMSQFGTNALPLYLYYRADSKEPLVVGKSTITEGMILSAIKGETKVTAAKDLTFLSAIGFALVAGAILNVMPCVFPVISLKIMGFVSQAGEDRRKILLHGLAFTAGVLVFFWFLAGILLAFRAPLA